MLCPSCREGQLTKARNGALQCRMCGLNRRPNDKILVRKETNFFVLNRNIRRSPAGTTVEIIITCHGLSGIYGTLKSEGPTYALRTEHGLIIAFSKDKDDLTMLIAEHRWRIEDTEIATLVDGLRNDKQKRNAGRPSQISRDCSTARLASL